MERCESGLIGRPGKSVCQQWHRGFESLSLRQLGNVFVGSPSARARQPILGAKLNFLSLFRKTERHKRAFLNFNLFDL